MRSIFERIKRMFYWGWNLRDNFDWDYEYVEKMLLLKLKRLHWQMENATYHMNLQDLYAHLTSTTCEWDQAHTKQNIKAYRALPLCIKILKRRLNNSTYMRLSGYEKFYEQNSLDFISINSVESKERYTASRPMRESMNRMEQRDKKWLYDLLYKWGEYWWV